MIMRAIKFRGKRKDEVWVYGSLAIDANGNHTILSPLSDKSGSEFWNNKFQFSEVDANALGQFTGLTDKNGNEIYEGDILWDKYCEEGIWGSLNYLIGWDEELACFKILDGGHSHYLGEGGQDCFGAFEYTDQCRDFNEVLEMKLIGNIHDNPELLKD